MSTHGRLSVILPKKAHSVLGHALRKNSQKSKETLPSDRSCRGRLIVTSDSAVKTMGLSFFGEKWNSLTSFK